MAVVGLLGLNVIFSIAMFWLGLNVIDSDLSFLAQCDSPRLLAGMFHEAVMAL